MTARLSVALAVALAWWSPATAQIAPGTVVVVLPFENPGAESRLDWMREGVATLVAGVLAAAGADLVERDERNLAYERLQLPTTASLSRASAIKVGQALGAAAIVVGRVTEDADALVVSARTVRLDSGRLSSESSSRGAPGELFDVAARLAWDLLAAPLPDAGWRVPPSLPAFELYIKGLIAESPALQGSLLEQAITIAPEYDAARLALWRIHTEQGEHQRALDSAAAVKPESATHRDARFAVAMSLMRLERYDEAFSALRAMQSRVPLAAVANALGVVQLRRGSSLQTGRATYYFNQATEIDPAEPAYFFNLGYAYWLEKDANGAAYWLREAVRRDPADGDSHFVLSVALQQSGARTEAARERELAHRLSSRYAAWEARAAGGGQVLPRGLERLHERLDPPSARVDTIIASSGQRDQAALAAFHLDAARRALDRDSAPEALRELRRALFLSPYLADAHVLMGRVHLRMGRADAAVQALKIAVWSEDSAPAQVALAEAYLVLEDIPSARAAVERALALDPRSMAALELKGRLPASR